MSVELIKLQYQDKNITLIPTAHVSKESAELTERTIDVHAKITAVFAVRAAVFRTGVDSRPKRARIG